MLIMRHLGTSGFTDKDFIRWGFDMAETKPLSSLSPPTQEQTCQNSGSRNYPEPASSETPCLGDLTPRVSRKSKSRRSPRKRTGRGEVLYKPVKKKKIAGAMTGVSGVDSTFPLDHMLSTTTYLLGDTIPFSTEGEASLDTSNKQSPTQGYAETVGAARQELGHSEEVWIPSRATDKPMNILCDEIGISEFLRLKGAMEVPHLAIRRELLQAFCVYVHPSLPCLDLPDVLSKVLNAPYGPPSTLLLAQSIMCAAAAFIRSPDQCYPCCRSRRDLRQTFFQKAKVMIYESNLEVDAITQIQSLLLMSSWQDNGDYAKDSYYWLSLAISTAQRLGLHQKANTPHSKHYHRLWWCIYLQDIRISLTLRRPRQIKDEDITVDPLTTQDLYCCFSANSSISPALASLQSVLNSRNLCAIARQFLHTLHLGVEAGKVLNDFYHASWTQATEPDSPLRLQPSTSITLRMGVSAEASLDSVARASGANAFGLKEELSGIKSENLSSLSFAIQRMDCYLLYLSALCYLFRSLDLSAQTSCSVWDARLLDAARDITSIVELFCHHIDITLMPGIAVAALTLAKQVHTLDLESGRGGSKMQSLSMFRLCAASLKGLYETYPTAMTQECLP